MPPSQRRLLIGATVALSALVSCGEGTPSRPSSVVGASSVVLSDTTPSVTETGEPTVVAVSSRELIVSYETGTCNQGDPPPLPNDIAVTYNADEIVVTIGTAISCRSDIDDISVSAAAKLSLSEDVEGRALRIVQNR